MNSLNELWKSVLSYIENSDSFTLATYNLWFKDLELYKLTNTTAYVVVDTDFKHNILTSRYMDILNRAVEETLGFHVEIALFVCSPESDRETEFRRFISKKVDEISETEPASAPEASEADEEIPEAAVPEASPAPVHRIYPEYTFEKFIVGSTNKFAYNAANSVIGKTASDYNPLFIYGQSGLGKTHLLYAIANKMRVEHPECNVLYVRGEEFANELIDSLSKKKPMNYFREKYRTVDMILVDDIQFISGKVACQEEFFHTFNALHEEKKQIVLSSDLPPSEMKTLEQRLVTRFQWGLTVDIQPPDIELRVAILKNKAQSLGIDIPNNVLMFLADHVKNNIRQLEGAVRKLNAYSILSDSPINLDTAKMLVSDILSNDAPPTFTTDKIFEIVCNRYGVSTEDVLSQKRNQNIVLPRRIILYFMRSILEMTFPDIGKHMNMHHSSVMTSIQKMEGMMKEDTAFEMEIQELGKEIQREISNV